MPNPYITNEKELKAAIATERLRPLLVRYRGKSEGRFTAPAQDIPDLLQMLADTDRYPRDVSFAITNRLA
jgi:hypothetical protein